MKRLLYTGLALAAALPAADAQRRYDYRDTPSGDREIIDRNYQEPHRPILDRLRRDLRVAKEELDRGFYGLRDELRRALHNRDHVVFEADDYHTEADRFDHFHRDDVSYRADESFGRFSPETLERARRRAAEREARQRAMQREAAIERELAEERARELADRTAPPQRRRPLFSKKTKPQPDRVPPANETKLDTNRPDNLEPYLGPTPSAEKPQGDPQWQTLKLKTCRCAH